MIDPGALREALDETRERLDEAAARGGRPAGAVELVLAGKYIGAAAAGSLVDAGVAVLGENRLQDLQAKRAEVGDRLTFDFIGHIQRRKARDVVRLCRLIHSVDSARLAAEIAARAEGEIRVLVEVNVAEEPTKGGIVPAQLRAFVEEVSVHADLTIGGLMVMPPFSTDAESSRRWFAAARDLAGGLADEWRGRHDFRDLSMGTSQDFLVAAEEGATKVRVGRGLLDRVQATSAGIS
ncbi:MAG: YggS family pyridoxal phosphate enzyme [Thermoleophilia bacterium]